jgi:hypothetical protein
MGHMSLEQAMRAFGSAPREPKYYRLRRHLTELTRAQPAGRAISAGRSLAAQCQSGDRYKLVAHLFCDASHEQA